VGHRQRVVRCYGEGANGADKFAIHGDDEESDAIVKANVELFRAFDEVIQKIDLELARAFLTVVERER
jgi:hypothetical protein